MRPIAVKRHHSLTPPAAGISTGYRADRRGDPAPINRQTIAPDNETAADALLWRIFGKLELAADQPQLAAARPELSPTARILVEGRYIIIYEPAPYGVLAVAVVHGMRDPESWMA